MSSRRFRRLCASAREKEHFRMSITYEYQVLNIHFSSFFILPLYPLRPLSPLLSPPALKHVHRQVLHRNRRRHSPRPARLRVLLACPRRNGKITCVFSGLFFLLHEFLCRNVLVKRGLEEVQLFESLGHGFTYACGARACLDVFLSPFFTRVLLQILAMGFPSVWAKFKLPYVMMMSLAYLCSAIGWLLNIRYDNWCSVW